MERRLQQSGPARPRGVGANLPVTARDPEAAARQYNIEYRAADAAASPHLALAAILHAGCQGIEDGLAPPPISAEDLSLLPESDLAARGYVRLPTTLDEALSRFQASATVTGWFPPDFAQVYVDHKRAELDHLQGMDVLDQCAAYERVY